MNELVKQWLIKAESDLKTARHELELGKDDDFYTPSFEEAKTAFDLALNINTFAKNKLGGSAHE